MWLNITAAASVGSCVLSCLLAPLQRQLDDFLKTCQPGSASAAKWGVCVLLLTAKTQTSALYKSLASRYKGKIAFGEVQGSHQVRL